MSEDKAVPAANTPAEQLTAAADGTRRSVVEDFASPVHYFGSLHATAISEFDKVITLAKTDAEQAAAKLFHKYMNWARSVIDASGRELAIFRALEHHIVRNSLTEEVVGDILNLLGKHRKQVLEQNQAAQKGTTS